VQALMDTSGARSEELEKELNSMRVDISTAKAGLAEAQKAQSFMLPKTPSDERYEYAYLYNPSEELGGDFYDFFPVSSDRIAIAIGDVTGHGVHAAIIMTMVKKLLKSYAISYGSPMKALIATNDELAQELDGKTFVSAFIGILDRATGVFQYARAGHNPPFHYSSREKKIYELASPGMVLGMGDRKMFEPAIQQRQLLLEPGDTLLVFTDGIVEATSPDGEEFGEPRLKEYLDAQLYMSAGELVDSIDHDVKAFTKGEDVNADDVTMICVRGRKHVRTGDTGHFVVRVDTDVIRPADVQ
jgi:sigma-B regulation protein RsbU (phosphoserine phosphatase)